MPSVGLNGGGIQVMFKARDLFNNYLLELQGQHSDAIQEQKHVAADIYFQFAQVSSNTCAVQIAGIPFLMVTFGMVVSLHTNFRVLCDLYSRWKKRSKLRHPCTYSSASAVRIRS